MNTSSEDAAEMASRKIQIHVLFSLSFLAIVGNSAVILTLVRKRIHGRSFGNIDHLILQLATSDLLVGFFCLAADGAWKYTYWWLAGNSACKFVKFMQMFALYCSTYTIVSIAIDRCIAIRSSCGLARSSHRQVVKIMSLCAWTMSVFCSLPQIYIFRTMASPFEAEKGFYEQCVTYGAYTEEWQEPAYILFTCAAMFVLPLIIIIISYTLIFKKIHDESEFRSEISTHGFKRGTSFNSTAGDHRDALMKKAKTKALCVSVLVIVTFLLCWAPYYTSVLYYVLAMNKPQEEDGGNAERIFQVIFFFGMSNSVFNPIIYGAFHMAQRSRAAWKRWQSRTMTYTSSFKSINANRLGLEETTLVFSPLSRANTFTAHTNRQSFNKQLRFTSVCAVKSLDV